jgi:hypothetical protein
MSILKSRVTKFAAAFAAALVVGMFCAGAAFATTTVNVTFTTPDSVTSTETVTLDALTNTTASPVFGQFYKTGWNVLATGSAAGQYATVDSVLQNALTQYNTAALTSYTLSDIWYSGKTLALTATDGAYTKCYPTYSQVSGTSYFYDLATYASSSFTSSLRSSSWTFTSGGTTYTVSNPESTGAVLALSYGSASTTDTSTTCATLAGTAYGSIASTTYPRMIFGGVDSGSVAGNRFCSNITGITIQ